MDKLPSVTMVMTTLFHCLWKPTVNLLFFNYLCFQLLYSAYIAFTTDLSVTGMFVVLVRHLFYMMNETCPNMNITLLQDKDAKFRLILVEARIHRLARYYKTKRVLPPTWK